MFIIPITTRALTLMSTFRVFSYEKIDFERFLVNSFYTTGK